MLGWQNWIRTSDRPINSRMLYLLSYSPIWCRHKELNPGPAAYKAAALPSEL